MLSETEKEKSGDGAVSPANAGGLTTHPLRRQLPVTYSILSADALLAFVNRHYAVPSLNSCELLLPSMNDTYLLLSNGARFIVRVYRSSWRTADEITYELDLLRHLESQGVPVSVPVAGSDGQWFRSVRAPEGTRYVAMFTYAEGEPLVWTDAEQCRTAGRLLADIHVHSDPFAGAGHRAEMTADAVTIDPLHSLAVFFEQRPDDWAYLQTFASNARQMILGMTETLDRGVCHGDFGGGNISVHDGALTAFDFDLCGVSWRALDLASIRQVARARKNEAMWEAFIAGYQDARPLPPVEHVASRLFEPLRRICRMSVQARYAAEWGVVRLNENSLSGEIAFLKQWEAENPFEAVGARADAKGD